jgi:glyoxylase-like metal-dependent hydrolase (beta-lactamase superfamily II)
MPIRQTLCAVVAVGAFLGAFACHSEPGPPNAASSSPKPTAPTQAAESAWCGEIPRAANESYKKVPGVSDWFDVYSLGDGVFALTEPRQFQEAISYLILGAREALLFDTGLGMVPIRPVVERLTKLPIVVLNSHTHYDHVGGNAEFDRILALDTAYTRTNQAGFSHAQLASEVAPNSFCGDAGRLVDTAAFRTKAWRSTRIVADGEILDLGGRSLSIIRVPGHTPDAVALLDRRHGLLFTGDTYYDAPLWLYVPETDLDAYERSLTRLIGLSATVRHLRPAHNAVDADPKRLAQALDAVRRVRAGAVSGEIQGDDRRMFHVGDISILTSARLLERRDGGAKQGGSGLDVQK